MNVNKARIFVSYSQGGHGPKWKGMLLDALAVFEKHHLLDVWQDGRIRLSTYFEDEIDQAMSAAQLAVVLLTPQVLESRFILEKEFPCLRDRQQGDKLPVVPVVCEPCNWKAHSWLRATQAPNKSKPLSELTPDLQEQVFRRLATDIAEELSRVALAMLPKSDQLLSSEHVYLDKFPITRGPALREEKLIGREQELALLDLAFAQPHTAIVSLVAWGGVGKTILVQHWLRRLQREGWFGAKRVYAWSFYSQGTKEDRQASEDMFLAHSLEWFGIKCVPTLSPWDKGRLLADAVARERTLLILDGIEPLQYPPGPMGGQLRAPGVQSLLKQLARKSNRGENLGLCLVTTREPLTDLADFQRREGSVWGSVLRVDLGNLTAEAGAALLHHAGANKVGAAEIKPNDKELFATSRELDGHALTLNLLGRFLARAHGGDIRRRDLVKIQEADREIQGGTTFKMLAAFENWFAKSGEFGARQLAILRILGLFDRPADPGCIEALRKPPVIAGLTDALFAVNLHPSTGEANAHPIVDEDWNNATSFLVDFSLLERRTKDDSVTVFDVHPLIREHFGTMLKIRDPYSWESAHSRLYSFLSKSTQYRPKTLEGLQPLYQAVAHGCQAGHFEEVVLWLWNPRITCGELRFSQRHLGAFGSELVAIICFFSKPWTILYEKLSESSRAWLLAQAAQCLLALGRLSEAREVTTQSLALELAFAAERYGSRERIDVNVMRSVMQQEAFERYCKTVAWTEGQRFGPGAASNSIVLCEIDLALGDVSSAIGQAHRSVDYADRHVATNLRVAARWMLSNALHNSGKWEEAMACLNENARIVAEGDDQVTESAFEIYALSELALADAERTTWLITLKSGFAEHATTLIEACNTFESWGQRIFGQRVRRSSYVEFGFDHLILGRASYYKSVIGNCFRDPSDRILCEEEITASAALAYEHLCSSPYRFRDAGHTDYLPLSLLAWAWLCSVRGNANEAQANLDDAWDMVARGPMRLHMADIHLYRARLFFREKHYPWQSAQDDLASAEKLINDCGYHRRDKELADAKQAILGA